MTGPKSLYKFVVPDRVDILETGLIRFTQPSALNDPLELQPIFEDLLSQKQFEEVANPPFEMVEQEIRKYYLTLSSHQKALISIEDLLNCLKTNPSVLEEIKGQISPKLEQLLIKVIPQGMGYRHTNHLPKQGAYSFQHLENLPQFLRNFFK